MRRISWKLAERFYPPFRRPRETRKKVEDKEREYTDFCKLVAVETVCALLSAGKLGKKGEKKK